MLRRSSTKSTPNHKILNKVLDFLDSSVWLLPIATFIEQRSIVFDRQQDDLVLYGKIHQEFGGLVDTLLECFCEDTNIRPIDLIEALSKMDREKLSAKNKASFEPLAAAQDFNVFVPMMMRKNVELQLQALQMIEFMCGLIPQVLQMEEGDRGATANMTGEEAERYILISVLRQSKEEFEREQKEQAITKEEMEKIMEDNKVDKQRLQKVAAQEEKTLAIAMQEMKEEETKKNDDNGKEEEKEKEQEKETPPSTSNGRRPSTSRPRTAKTKNAKSPAPRRSTSKSESIDDEKADKKGKTAADVHALLKETERISTADIRNRAEYLREQRDRLLLMKQREREKQLNESSKKGERPKTAKAARGAMRGQVAGSSSVDVLAARRALVERIRGQVS